MTMGDDRFKGANDDGPTGGGGGDGGGLAPGSAELSELLADWVDGRLTAEQLDRIGTLSDRASLEVQVERMRANAALLRSLQIEKAPATLASRVMRTLDPSWQDGVIDRDVLATIGMHEMHAAGEPVRIRRAGSGRGWYYAAAACATLAVTWFALRPGAAPTSPGARGVVGPIARANEAIPAEVASATGAKREPLVRREAGTPGSVVGGGAAPPALADAAAVESAALARVAAAKAVGPTMGTLASAPADAGVGGTTLGPVMPERAVALAREGRLVMRVRAKDTRALAQLERQGRTGTPGGWTLRTRVPPSVIASVIAPRPEAYPPRPTGTAPERAIAGVERSTALIAGMMSAVPTIVVNQDDPMSRVRGTYLAEFAATDRAMSAVRSAFSGRLGAEVAFEELAEPIEAPPAATPERVLWWTQPSSEWAPRVVVPIVVEQG